MIEAKTYRYYDHSGVTGMRFHYRTDEEVAAWKARDPIDSLESRMVAGEVATREQLIAVWDSVGVEVADAVAFAESSPPPDVAALLDDVYTVAAR